MTYALAHLAPLGALVAAFGIGGQALARLLVSGSDARELRPLATCVLGVTLWMVALFALACVGGLGRTGVVAIAAGCVALWVWARRRRDPAAAATGARTPLGAPFIVGALLLTSPLWLLALSWEVSWDAGAYHLMLPKRYLAAGGFEAVPGNVYSNWPLATELLYAAALAIGNHPLAKALHAGFGLATLWAVWLGARAFHREASGWIAAPLVLASPVVLFEWSVAYVDLAYAFFFLAGLLFVTRWRTSGGRERHALWLAGVCGGALAGVKVSGVLGAVALGAALLGPLAARALRGEWRAVLADAARFALPVALLWLPWLAKSVVYTGNPVYPLLYDVFGGPDWSPRLAEQFMHWQRSIGMGRAPLDYLLLPWRVVVEGGASYDRFAGVLGMHWLVVVPLAGFGHRNPLVRAGSIAALTYFVLWALGSQQARFLVPILPPLALCGSIGAVEALRGLRDPRLQRGAALVLFGIALALAFHALRGPTTRALELAPALARGGEAHRRDAVHPVYRFVATLPQDAKLLLMNTNQGFFLTRDFLADSFFEASQTADWLRGVESAEQARARLAARGITHVLRARRGWGIRWPEGLSALLADPRLAAPRYRASDGAYEVFELLPDPSDGR